MCDGPVKEVIDPSGAGHVAGGGGVNLLQDDPINEHFGSVQDTAIALGGHSVGTALPLRNHSNVLHSEDEAGSDEKVFHGVTRWWVG